MKHQLPIAAALALLLSGCGLVNNPRVNGGDGVSNGGDPVKILASQGKLLAPEMVQEFNADLLPGEWAPEVKQWIVANHDDLAKDIAVSEHVWGEPNQTTCATTTLTRNQPISFSYSLCRQSMPYLEQAVRGLIH